MAVGLCLAALVMSSLTPFYFALFFLLVVFSTSHRNAMAQLAIMLLYSSIMIPKLPGEFYMYQLLLMVWVALIIAQNIIDKRSLLLPSSWALAVVFILNVFLVIAVRGFGVRALGGGQSGGMIYIQSVAAFAFYIYSRRLIMTEKQWKRCFVIMAILALVPVIAQGIFLASGGLVWHQFLFVRFSSGGLLQYRGQMDGSGTTRWTMLGGLTTLYWIAIAVWEYKGLRNVMMYMLFFAVSILAAIAASYRSGMIITTGTLFLIFIIYSRSRRAAIMLILAAVAVSIPVVSFFYEDLPFSVQRTLTVLPWINAQTAATLDAADTIDWRKMLWSRTVSLIPQYLLIGRGYTFDYDVVELMQRSAFSQSFQLDYFIHVGSFHHGSLELLILLGIPGLLTSVLFVGNEIRIAVLNMNKTWNSQVLKRYFQALFAYFFCLSVVNLLAGSSQPVITQVPIFLGLMWALWQSDQSIGRRKTNVSAPPLKKRIIVGI
ncbi:MAG: hypothetical protein EOM20_02285 [Spartobacteria bacterium]|nr:hypothetical protein [Spartobacteria bacterium]